MQFDEWKLCKSYETYNISDLPKFYDYDLVIVILEQIFFLQNHFNQGAARRILDYN